jgi:tetratricopeptide (TPR) repeat protein
MPVTSFVPSDPGMGMYQVNMQKADDAFRQGRYEEALGGFDVASRIARRAAESHLGKVHALFALGQYYGASGDLREALKYLPELPLVHLRLRGFYGQDKLDDFAGHVERLRKRLDDPLPDPDLLLVLAYVRYFDGDQAEAESALLKASGRAKEPALKEAIETFLVGMAAAGKSATQPAEPSALEKVVLEATSRPASAPAEDAPPTEPGPAASGAKAAAPETPDPQR